MRFHCLDRNKSILLLWLLLKLCNYNVSSFLLVPKSTNSFLCKKQHPSKSTTCTSSSTSILVSTSSEDDDSDKTVTIISRGEHHIIAMKPPSVVCHHSNWTGSRKKKLKVGEEPEIPMLQRVRDAIDSIDRINKSDKSDKSDDDDTDSHQSIKKINLVHRLDRGASGILLCAFADDNTNNDDNNDDDEHEEEDNIVEETINSTDELEKKPITLKENTATKYTIVKKKRTKGPTAILQEEMSKSSTTKTYIALVRGEGILHGEDMKQNGWFEINRPIKDEKGRFNNATTLFNFVAGQAEPQDEGNDIIDDERSRIMQPRISLVLARPQDGRWHQIRRHLNGLSHPILGDTSHGSSKSNREWKEKRNLPGERICLHLARLEMSPTKYTPEGIDISCPLPQDMLDMLKVYAPDVLNQALPILEKEGILIKKPPAAKYLIGKYKIPDSLLLEQMTSSSRTTKVKDIPEAKILCQNDHYVVASKPHGVVVHNSSWTRRRRNEPMPMLQRVRDATGKKVNPIHRLDRSASGCLVFAFANEDEEDGGGGGDDDDNDDDDEHESNSRDVTNILIQSLQSKDASKTYLALCDGDGEWNGVNFLEKGWFTVDRPVKDENDKLIDAKTDLRFVASVTLPLSETDDEVEGRKISIVLAKPNTGRYHQIRQHMASGRIGHAILGDSSHGRKRTNRIWKKKRGLLKERTCLHLSKIDLPKTKYSPNGIQAVSPLPEDLLMILNEVPGLIDKARPVLSEEGITI